MCVFIFLGEKRSIFLEIFFFESCGITSISHSHFGQRIEWIWESGGGGDFVKKKSKFAGAMK